MMMILIDFGCPKIISNHPTTPPLLPFSLSLPTPLIFFFPSDFFTHFADLHPPFLFLFVSLKLPSRKPNLKSPSEIFPV